ncbi:MAG: hypothetical protein LAO06_11485 [Acidobacteriia bacterium]|nr:hypothetical protein [Terriglobia bacterium]
MKKHFLWLSVMVFLVGYVARSSAQSCDPSVMYTYQNTWLQYDIVGNPMIIGENVTSSCFPSTPAFASVDLTMPSGYHVNGPAMAYNYGVADALTGSALTTYNGTIEAGDAILSGSNLLSFPTACFAPAWTVRVTVATYLLSEPYPDGYATYTLNCPNGNQHATCGTANYLGSQTHIWAEEFGLYTNPGGCFFFGVVQYKDGPPAPYQCK